MIFKTLKGSLFSMLVMLRQKKMTLTALGKQISAIKYVQILSSYAIQS